MAKRKFEHPPRENIINDAGQQMPVSWNMWFSRIADVLPTILIVSETITPALVAAGTTAEQTFTINQVSNNDTILHVHKPTHQAGLALIDYYSSADGQLTIRFMNISGAGITPTAEAYEITLIKG